MPDMFPMHRTADGTVPAEALIDAELLKDLLDYVGDGVCLLDLNNQVLYWNQGAEQITGYLAHEVSGRHCSDDLALCHDSGGTALCDTNCPLARVKDDGKPRECLLYIRHRQGHRIPVRMRAHAILDAKGQVTGVAEVFARATAQGRTELAEAARHRGHDGLTGAQNRAYGEMRLEHELQVASRFGLATAWMRVNMDGIEALQRNFGHGMVESALGLIAHTIDANLNSFDALVRWDESSFRVMVRHAVENRVDELAGRLALMVRTSQVQWWGEGRDVTVSIASVMAGPEDTVASLEERVGQAFESGGGVAGEGSDKLLKGS